MAPFRYHRLSLMKRGMYDVSVRPNSFLEKALLFHEMQERRKELKKAELAGFGSMVEDPEEAMDQLEELVLPGVQRNREAQKKRKAAYLRSLRDVDWTSVFELDDHVLEKRKRKQKAKDALGPVAD